MNTIETFFAFLRAEVCDMPLPKDEKIELTPQRLEALYHLSKRHDLAHVICSAVEKENRLLGEGQIPEEFIKQKNLAIYRYGCIDFELERICRSLDRASIPYIPLKGAVIRTLYPEPWMRTSCDIDILIHEEDLERAVSCLVSQLEYSCDGKREFHEISLFSKSGVHLELHFSLLETMENIDRLLIKVWDYAKPAKPDSFEYRLTDAFLLFHITSHMVYHFMGGGCGVRSFLDLWLLNRRLDYDENVLLDMCRECGIETFFRSALRLADVWFFNRTHDELTKDMQGYVLLGGVYGHVRNRVAVQQLKKGSKGGYLRSRLFVPYDVLKIRYPILKKYRYLTPFYEVKRWADVIFSGNAKRSMKDLRVNQTMPKKQSEQVEALFSRLGL